MIKLCENSYFEVARIKQLLQNNNIEAYEVQKTTSAKSPSSAIEGGDFLIEINVKKCDYIKANEILEKYLKSIKLKTLTTVQYLEQIKQLDSLIRTKNTGILSVLSKKIGLKQRQVLIQLNFLKCLNAKIKFSKEFNSFYYTNSFEFLFQFSLLSITDDDIIDLYCSSEDETTINFRDKSEFLE